MRLLAQLRRYTDHEVVEILDPEFYGEVSADEPGRPRKRWDLNDVLAAMRRGSERGLAERQIRLYEWMRDAGARESLGSGEDPQLTMFLGEPDHSVSVGFYAGGIWINLDALRRKRAPAEMERLAELLRRVPGVDPCMEEAEKKQWGMHASMDVAEVLASDAALEAWKRALSGATTPVG